MMCVALWKQKKFFFHFIKLRKENFLINLDFLFGHFEGLIPYFVVKWIGIYMIGMFQFELKMSCIKKKIENLILMKMEIFGNLQFL